MIETSAVEYPVRFVCEILGIARSSYYHRRIQLDEHVLRESLQTLAQEQPTYGYRRLTVEIREHLGCINSKRVRRLMGQLGLSRKRKRKKRYTTQWQHDYPRYPNLVQDLLIVRPNQVWVIGRFLDDVYMHKRIHSALGYLTPAAFEAEWLANRLNAFAGEQNGCHAALYGGMHPEMSEG